MSGMGFEPGQAASLLRWWRDAGVDVAVQEHPPAWIDVADAPVIERAAAPVAPASNSAERRATPVRDQTPAPRPIVMPTDPAEIDNWLLQRSEERGARHVAAVGPLEATLMIVGDRPDRGDVTEEKPFGGENGALAAAMVRAMGHGFEEIRQSLVEPGHLPGERLSDHDLLGRIARIQLAHSKPRMLVLFGDASARALLGEPLAKARGHLHTVEGIPTVATFHPRWLLQRPQDKKLAWADLLLLLGAR